MKQTLTNHIRNKHSNNVRNFQCDLCDKAYKTASALHNHRIYHSDDPKYPCDYCEKKFHFNFLLQQHEQQIHLGKLNGGGKTWECTVCQKSFNSRNKLTKHKLIHSKNMFKCTICDFKGTLKRYLVAHMKRMHKKSE